MLRRGIAAAVTALPRAARRTLSSTGTINVSENQAGTLSKEQADALVGRYATTRAKLISAEIAKQVREQDVEESRSAGGRRRSRDADEDGGGAFGTVSSSSAPAYASTSSSSSRRLGYGSGVIALRSDPQEEDHSGGIAAARGGFFSSVSSAAAAGEAGAEADGYREGMGAGAGVGGQGVVLGAGSEAARAAADALRSRRATQAAEAAALAALAAVGSPSASTHGPASTSGEGLPTGTAATGLVGLDGRPVAAAAVPVKRAEALGAESSFVDASADAVVVSSAGAAAAAGAAAGEAVGAWAGQGPAWALGAQQWRAAKAARQGQQGRAPAAGS